MHDFIKFRETFCSSRSCRNWMKARGRSEFALFQIHQSKVKIIFLFTWFIFGEEIGHFQPIPSYRIIFKSSYARVLVVKFNPNVEFNVIAESLSSKLNLNQIVAIQHEFVSCSSTKKCLCSRCHIYVESLKIKTDT